MHVPNETEIVFVLGCLANGLPPFFDEFENLVLYASIPNRRSLWKPTNKLIQKLFRADLQMEWIPAVLDTYVKQL